MLVKIEMEVGEFARGLSEPYLVSGTNRIDVDYVQGLIERIDKKGKYIKIENYGGTIPFHRVYEFTFGGVLVDNKKYDIDRIMQENSDAVKKLSRRQRHRKP